MRNTVELIQDMLNAIASIESYKIESFEAFLKDQKTQDAIMFNLIIMGEAAGQIPHDFHLQYPKIPWSSIIGTRNIIVHGYAQVKLPIIWDILQKDLLPLKVSLEELI